ncbi:zinc finger protein 827-like [Anthonomus grandis grandis]|uniref:zinc finger protein 827-like n=1 Tax=Anthonomus grandis grandis TaxID=2921223 RepID=UPI0021655BA4|nr:zinc finger protein 827-like [Anthonomus grandis grandis]XP_050307785.1 zinc finger protein 827-like [Anthonomus grandis grandis]XP_050307786.1 zinc finger protein 827-like [Anthonomus grandis grandis]
MGSTEKKTYCRLCLCKISGENVLLNGFEKDMLEVILPELNITICSQPSMCKPCTETLRQLYGFKSICLEVEDKVQGFVNPKTSSFVDLNEVVKKTVRCNISGKLSVCRTCLTLSQESELSKLGNSAGDPLRNMVEKCLPEMGLNITKEPSICSHCLEQFEEQFNFIMQCLDTESKINYYCETKNILTNVDLHNVYQFSIRMEESGENGKQYEEIPGSEEVIEISPRKRPSNNMKREQIVDLTKDNSPVKKTKNHIPEKKTRRSMLHEAPVEEVTFQMAINHKGEQIITSETTKIVRENVSDSEESVKRESELLMVKKVVSTTRSSPRRNSITANHKMNGVVQKRKWEFKDDDYHSEDDGSAKPKRLLTQKCKYCKFKTKFKSRMKAHMTRYHKSELEEEKAEMKLFKCRQCTFKTECEKAYQDHKAEHKKERERQSCPHCEATFIRPDFLTKHIATHKENDKNEPFIPKTVKKKKVKQLAITSTMSRPGNSRTSFMMNGRSFKMFKCGVCPYQTRLKSNYHKHVSIHKTGQTGITVNKCAICRFETIHKENYLSHMAKHKNEQADVVRRCFLCSFQPNSEQELAMHVSKVHKSGSG